LWEREQEQREMVVVVERRRAQRKRQTLESAPRQRMVARQG
jgi:hypothetical protein